MMNKIYTQIQLGSVIIPPLADFTMTENVGLISAASDLRRTVNGEPINVARAQFRKYFLNITGSGARVAGVFGATIGDYCEALPAEPFSLSTHRGGATVVELPRACVEVVGITHDGRHVEPDVQPTLPLPFHVDRTTDRVAALRVKPIMTFPEEVAIVRFRPVLACVVADWTADADEQNATANWSLRLEEI